MVPPSDRCPLCSWPGGSTSSRVAGKIFTVFGDGTGQTRSCSCYLLALGYFISSWVPLGISRAKLQRFRLPILYVCVFFFPKRHSVWSATTPSRSSASTPSATRVTLSYLHSGRLAPVRDV